MTRRYMERMAARGGLLGEPRAKTVRIIREIPFQVLGLFHGEGVDPFLPVRLFQNFPCLEDNSGISVDLVIRDPSNLLQVFFFPTWPGTPRGSVHRDQFDPSNLLLSKANPSRENDHGDLEDLPRSKFSSSGTGELPLPAPSKQRGTLIGFPAGRFDRGGQKPDLWRERSVLKATPTPSLSFTTIGRRVVLSRSPHPPCSDLHPVRVSRAARPPGPSRLHPTDSAGDARPCTVPTAPPWPTAVHAAVPTPGAQPPQLAVRLQTHHGLCSGA